MMATLMSVYGADLKPILQIQVHAQHKPTLLRDLLQHYPGVLTEWFYRHNINALSEQEQLYLFTPEIWNDRIFVNTIATIHKLYEKKNLPPVVESMILKFGYQPVN